MCCVTTVSPKLYARIITKLDMDLLVARIKNKIYNAKRGECYEWTEEITVEVSAIFDSFALLVSYDVRTFRR